MACGRTGEPMNQYDRRALTRVDVVNRNAVGVEESGRRLGPRASTVRGPCRLSGWSGHVPPERACGEGRCAQSYTPVYARKVGRQWVRLQRQVAIKMMLETGALDCERPAQRTHAWSWARSRQRCRTCRKRPQKRARGAKGSRNDACTQQVGGLLMANHVSSATRRVKRAALASKVRRRRVRRAVKKAAVRRGMKRAAVRRVVRRAAARRAVKRAVVRRAVRRAVGRRAVKSSGGSSGGEARRRTSGVEESSGQEAGGRRDQTDGARVQVSQSV